MMGSQVTCWTWGSTWAPAVSVRQTPCGVSTAISPSPRKKHIARVIENRGDIACDEIFALAEAHYDWRT